MLNDDKLAKLIKRIDLDRPILAQEKMKFIMLEKKDDGDESSKINETKTSWGNIASQSLMASGSVMPGNNNGMPNS